jgi:hypothetical protein
MTLYNCLTVKKKLIEKRITIGFSKPEIERLEAYCQITGRSYTDVIRECVRNLTSATVLPVSERTNGKKADPRRNQRKL